MSKKINPKMVNALAEVIESNDSVCRQMIHRLSIYNPAALVNVCKSVVKDYEMGVRNEATSSTTHAFEQIFKAYDGSGLDTTEKFVKSCIVQGLNKVNCIKELRDHAGLGLKEAKEFVEDFATKHGLTLKNSM